MTSIQSKTRDDKIKVLSDWKKLYTEALIDALHPKGDVLEIGFDTGEASERILKHQPKSLTIIESNPQIAAAARKWAAQKPNIKIVEEQWQATLPKLGAFDTIFYNIHPLEEYIAALHYLFPEDTLKRSNEAKKLAHELGEQISKATQKYTDKEIDDFYQKIGKDHLLEIPVFFQRLKENGNISKAQYENFNKKHHLSDSAKDLKKGKQDPAQKKEDLLLFLEEAFKKHMKRNGRFSSFLLNQISKYEDSKFFDSIITNPNIDYKESTLEIKTSDQPRNGLFMVVEKIA